MWSVHHISIHEYISFSNTKTAYEASLSRITLDPLAQRNLLVTRLCFPLAGAVVGGGRHPWARRRKQSSAEPEPGGDDAAAAGPRRQVLPLRHDRPPGVRQSVPRRDLLQGTLLRPRLQLRYDRELWQQQILVS